MDDLLQQAESALAAGDYPRAIALLSQMLQTNPDHVVAWHNLGSAYLVLSQFREAATAYHRAVTLDPEHLPSWPPLARALMGAGQLPAAESILEQWLQLSPDSDAERLLLARIKFARFQNFEVIDLLAPMVARADCPLEAQWLHTMAFAPPIYDSEEQITELLSAIEERLAALRARVLAAGPAELQEAATLMELATPLFLPYNGRDVKKAHMLAGDMYVHALAATLGTADMGTAASRKARHDADDGRIRLAIVSETFHYHSNMKLRRSWLRRIDRTKFRLCLYHAGTTIDSYTADIKLMCDEFHHYPKDFSGLLAQLRADRPDIIQYTNIGLSMLTLKLAAMRIAPVQVNTWGHPITSGLSTMDYFITNALMEPPEAQDYYNEQLVYLPGLSLVPENIFAEQNLPDLPRASFGLADDDVFYLCLQSLQKYLPRDDGIYAAIAAGVPKAKFIFIEPEELKDTHHIFRARLQATFTARGMDPARHLIFLPTQNQTGYRALHRLADVTLDSMGWSGANTTFEALELGALLLTLPGQFMRARHTAAILKLMQMDELIVDSVDAYIARAIEFGHDPELRRRLKQKTQDALPLLYQDPGLAPALNAFYEKAYTDWAARH